MVTIKVDIVKDLLNSDKEEQIVLSIDEQMTVDETIGEILKKPLGFRESCERAKLCIVFGETHLLRNTSLEVCKIQEGSTIILKFEPPVERCFLGLNAMKFVPVEGLIDVSEIDTTKKFKPGAPEWRIWCTGMNMECICPNKDCEYSKVRQVIGIGLGTLNIVDIYCQAKCKLCKTMIYLPKDPTDPVKNFTRAGFNNCYFKFEYVYKNMSSGGSVNWIMAPRKPTWLDGYINSDEAQEYYKLVFTVISVNEHSEIMKKK